MKNKFLGQILFTATLVAGMGIASAYTKPVVSGPRTDAEVIKGIVHEIRMYPQYSIWDDLNIRVANGQATITGAVNQPYKKSDIENIVRRVPGVTSLASEIKVLPLSSFDDRLRIQVARAIYGDPSFTRYAMQPLKPIHIIVANGHVTLAGVVANESDKNLAGLRASGAGLGFGPVVNDLQVETPAVKK